MKKMCVDGYDFYQMPVMKYYQPPASWSNEKRQAEVKKRIFSDDWIGARKMDGAFFEFIKDDNGDMVLIGRSVSTSGDYLDKIDIVPHIQPFFDALPNGTVLLGELYLPQHEGAKNTTSITNCLPEKAIARQNSSEDMKLHYYVFDCLALNGENLVNLSALLRFYQVMELEKYGKFNYVEYAQYYHGKELWDNLQEILAEGGEGIVILNVNSVYEPGKRSTKTSMKVKKELQQTIDCVVIGANAPSRLYSGDHIEDWQYWENMKTGEKVEGFYYNDYKEGKPIEPISKNWFYGWCGSLKIGLYKDGILIHYGDLSGLTEDIKANWKDYVGQVVEVGGMQLDDESGVIRHPKIINWRNDKMPNECTWEQVMQI